MGFLDKFLKKKEAQKTPVSTEPIRVGPGYFVSGDKVVFDLNGMDYSFEKFYLLIADAGSGNLQSIGLDGQEPIDEGLYINVPEEAPMNLINIAGASDEEEGVELDREEVLGADTAKLSLKLADRLF